jgi:hypothetical protein
MNRRVFLSALPALGGLMAIEASAPGRKERQYSSRWDEAGIPELQQAVASGKLSGYHWSGII